MYPLPHSQTHFSGTHHDHFSGNSGRIKCTTTLDSGSSAHRSIRRKNAASCEIWCELQDTLSTDFSNAHCGLGSCPGPRLSEGRIRLAKEIHFSNWPRRSLLDFVGSSIHRILPGRESSSPSACSSLGEDGQRFSTKTRRYDLYPASTVSSCGKHCSSSPEQQNIHWAELSARRILNAR
ncbi:hypothetical protein AVEN_22250-1 [Araneus ventricosus]|uniref:Uncharacterized protein n=1 Tax=Araneus ventricosus TaxID=182803 RepID=A0A4Y2K4Q5_ARAVE|nr:hypothetical protein AVEN_22250-1 [Araneus ventricosus]